MMDGRCCGHIPSIPPIQKYKTHRLVSGGVDSDARHGLDQNGSGLGGPIKPHGPLRASATCSSLRDRLDQALSTAAAVK